MKDIFYKVYDAFREPVSKLMTGEGAGLEVSQIVLRFLLLLTSFAIVYFIMRYIRDYRLIESMIAKIKGDMKAFDRIKRSQMRTQMEADAEAFSKREDNKNSLMNKLYHRIGQTGLVDAIPGFSEAGALMFIMATDLIIFLMILFRRNLIVALTSAGAIALIFWYLLDLAAYTRKIKMEKQLLQFVNACSSASMQYANLIDIFGAIYDQFGSPLREALEACYIEAKTNNDKDAALKHLKNKFDSSQFTFIIDNLELCSSVTGDYYAAAKDISQTISIYATSHEKKMAILRNAKINIIVMFGFAIGIMYMVSMFLGGIQDVILHSTFGNIVIVVMVLILFYGLNMKAEKN